MGASAVTITFAEVVPALQKGVADCGITGTLPAYNAKWWQVVTHNIRVRLGYVASFLAVNNKVWNSLSKDTQALIQEQAKKLEEEMWVATARNNQRGMDCNASGPCDLGKPGGMVPVELSDADKAFAKQIVNDFVLRRWAKRCGQKCADEWNATVGKLLGLKAQM
jgi:TRAP-type C4-dicarboxylate transport system substrate-binding protein